jgi:hypothetical protein
VLHAPTTWLDNQTHDGATVRTIREMLAVRTRRESLVAGLKKSLPMPGLTTVTETNPDEVMTAILAGRKSTVGKHDKTADEKLVAFTRQTLRSHTHIADVDETTEAEPLPATRRVMRPLDLLPEGDDLVGLDESALKVKWCSLIAIEKWEGRAALVEFLKAKELEGWRYGGSSPKRLPRADSPDLDFYRALHDYFYVHKGISYSDTSTKQQVMAPFGFKLVFVGPTSFDLLYKAKLKAGGRYIVDIHHPGHTMKMVVSNDFEQPVGPGQTISDFISFENDGTNWNKPLHETLRAHVVNVWQQ